MQGTMIASAPTQSVPLSGKHVGRTLLLGYLVLYAVVLFFMHRTWQFDLVEPLLVLAILGVGFSLAAWLFTIGTSPLTYRVMSPAKELSALASYMLPLTAYITWGGSVIRHYVLAGPIQACAILSAKLAFFVILPVIIMRALGYGPTELAPISFRRRDVLTFLGLSILLLGFQAVFGRGWADITQARLSASTLAVGFPVAFLWLAIEAGVVEEFFFRVLLQSRLSAALRSELGGIVLMSLVFGLAHAPGLYLRTGLTQEGLPSHPPLLMAIGYSIVITSVAGFFFGVLWARTRNFALVVVLHAITDLLPDMLPTLRSLHLLH